MTEEQFNFEQEVEGIDKLRKIANELETSGATSAADPAAAEFARFMQKGLSNAADETENALDKKLHQEADEGEKLL